MTIKKVVLTVSVNKELKDYLENKWRELKYRSRSHFIEDVIKMGLEEKRKTIGEIGGIKIQW